MSDKRTGGNIRVLLADAEDEQVSSLDDLMPDWEVEKAPEGWPENAGSGVSGDELDAVIVYAEKGGEQKTLQVCKAIREKNDTRDIPLFVAIDQYQMDLGNRVKRLPQADFVIAPFEKSLLEMKVKALMPGASED